MTTSPQKKHVAFVSFVSYSSVTLVLLLLFPPAQTFGLQPNQASTCLVGRRPISSLVSKQQICLSQSSPFSSDAQALVEEKTTAFDWTQTDKNTQPISTYDWDEQFEELHKFKSEYGHCNFPQNPSKELKQKYPMLPRFCEDQRREYQLLQRNSRRHERMTLPEFDRTARCRQLEELGFEFNSILAKWYDSYHELLDYSRENGHTRVTKSENEVLTTWIYTQRRRRTDGAKAYAELSDLQIKLLDDIGFLWKSELFDVIWNGKYKELVAFRNEHGNFLIENGNPLYVWISQQRQRRAGKKGLADLTEEQIRLLDEIEFPWEPYRYDSMWFSMYDELKQFHKEFGHCRPVYSTHLKLYKWARDQKVKHQGGLLSSEQIKLLNEIHFPWERKKTEWPMMLTKLVEYCNTHGHIQISQVDDTGLYDWMEIQRRRYQGNSKGALSDEQIERLEDLHFCWSLEWRDRMWHEKYTEAVEHFKEHGHISVTEMANPSLYNWIQTQEKRYQGTEGQKPLSEEEMEMLEQIEFPFLEGQLRMAWNAMRSKVVRYRYEDNDRLPMSHKDEPHLSRWLWHQRYKHRCAYGYAPLSDQQKELLQSTDVSFYPQGKRARYWYEMYDELVDFWRESGHFTVGRKKTLLSSTGSYNNGLVSTEWG